MAITFLSDCGNSTGDFSEWTVSGTQASSVTLDTSKVRNGNTYAIKLTSNAAAANKAIWLSNSLVADSGTRISFFYGSNAANSRAATIWNNGTGSADGVILRSDFGFIQVRIGTTSISSGSINVDDGNLHHVVLQYRLTSTTNWRVAVWVDGNLEYDIDSTLTVDANGLGRNSFQFYCFGTTGTTIAHWISDLFVETTSTFAFPGTINVTRKKANTNGTNNAFDTAIGSATNRWDYVSERPISTGKGWKQASSSQVIEAYGIESASQGDANTTGGTILGWKAWLSGKGQLVTTGAPKLTAANSDKTTGTTLQVSNVVTPVAIGDVAVVAFADQVGGSSPTIADDLGNTWIPLSGPTTNTVRASKWYSIIANPGIMTVTITFGSSAASRAGVLAVWDASAFGASPLDKNITNANDSTTPYDCPTSGTLAQADEIVLGFVFVAGIEGNINTVTSPSTLAVAYGSTGGNAATNSSVAISYRKVTATTAVAPQFTGTSRTGIVSTASFKITPINAGTPKLMNNGNEVAITLGDTQTLYYDHTASGSYPSGGNTIGMKSSGSNMDTFLYECGMQIAYIPVASAVVIPVFMRQYSQRWA